MRRFAHVETNAKKEHILNVALKLFSERGYSATSVREIAKQAKVNLSMISYYFGGKEGLLDAIVNVKSNKLVIRMEEIMQSEWTSTDEVVELLIDELVERFWENRAVYELIANRQNFKENKVLKKTLVELRKVRFEQFKSVIQSAVDKGLFRKDVNIPLLHASAIGLMKHINFSNDFYLVEMGLGKNKEGDTKMKNEVKMYLTNLFKLMLDEK